MCVWLLAGKSLPQLLAHGFVDAEGGVLLPALLLSRCVIPRVTFLEASCVPWQLELLARLQTQLNLHICPLPPAATQLSSTDLLGGAAHWQLPASRRWCTDSLRRCSIMPCALYIRCSRRRL